MKLKVKRFEELTLNELYEILRVRVNVFVVEQNCPYGEIDGIDYESIHVFYEDSDQKVIAYARIFRKLDEDKTLQIGRVLTTQRSMGWGIKILERTLQVSKDMFIANEIYIEAQTYAIGFYEKVGFVIASDEFLEDNIPHVKMRLKI